MENDLLTKDVYITEELKSRLVGCLCRKTGLEWYMFRRKVDITQAIKQYVIETIECFDETEISFDGFDDYNEVAETCLAPYPYNRNVRLTFKFTEDEALEVKKLCKRKGYQQETNVLNVILFALANSGKKLSASLSDFADFFLGQNYVTLFHVPSEIFRKIENCPGSNYKGNHRFFFKKVLFWQIKFGETPAITEGDENYFRVTPQKTNWRTISFCSTAETKNFISNKKYGSTLNVAFLNAVNAYINCAEDSYSENQDIDYENSVVHGRKELTEALPL